MADEDEGEVKWLEERLDEQDNLLKSLQAQITAMAESWTTNYSANLSQLTETEEWKSLVAQITETQTTAAEISSQLATLSERSLSLTPVVVPVIQTPQASEDGNPANPVVPTSPKSKLKTRLL